MQNTVTCHSKTTLQIASKHTIWREKNNNFCGGAHPSQASSLVRRTPSSHPHRQRLLRIDPRTFGTWVLTLNPTIPYLKVPPRLQSLTTVIRGADVMCFVVNTSATAQVWRLVQWCAVWTSAESLCVCACACVWAYMCCHLAFRC